MRRVNLAATIDGIAFPEEIWGWLDLLGEALAGAGHIVLDHFLLPNDESRVRSQLQAWLGRDDLDLIVLTGGTGLGSRDRTIEVVRPLLEKHLADYRQDTKAAGELLKTGLAPAPAALNKSELAAWTHIARVLLNLHETITRA